MKLSREIGSWVWLPSVEEVHVPAKVISIAHCGALTLQTEDGKNHEVGADAGTTLLTLDKQCLDANIENLIELNDLNENAILHNLRIRFKEDVIYTNVANILISVNPFKPLTLYTPEIMDQYRHGSQGKSPHVFAVAANAYSTMMRDRSDQSVVISGESGAGKSEAMKLILQFITDMSSKFTGISAANVLEQQILQANPLLEALGNAKTIRNNNSSRFGKLITVKFEGSGNIVSGNVIEFLLEKSRVVYQAKEERNYHVFYELIAGCTVDAKMRARLQLGEASDYYFLSQSGVIAINGHSDESQFEGILRAMATLNYNDDETDLVYRVIAGILHISNIVFDIEAKAMEEDGSKIGNPTVLETATKLLGLDANTLAKALTKRNVGSRSVILVSYSPEQAMVTRDAMCKSIYGGLFSWTIAKINKLLDTGTKFSTLIGVLDIFGFESFENNSFEQLCINFCNEKLTYHFNQHVFKLEQQLYESELVQVHKSDFVDNQLTLDLLEKKTTGIFAILDEEISVPKGSDAGFLSKVVKVHEKHSNFSKATIKFPKNLQRVGFGVRHYAGEVIYNTTGFLDKNKDRLHKDVVAVVTASSSPFIQSLIEPTNSSRKSKTLGSQFKKQLNDLMTTLDKTFPHFVRCLKSNKDKVGSCFDADMILTQMRYSGLLEVCRIRKVGYPVRKNFHEFYSRYQCIEPKATDLLSLIHVLSTNGILQESQWAKGISKLFMRNDQYIELERGRELALENMILRLQAFARYSLARHNYFTILSILSSIKDAIETHNEDNIISVLSMCVELPHSGTHVSIIKEARAKLIQIQEEKRVTLLLNSALSARDKSTLVAAIAAAAEMSPSFMPEKFKEAEVLLARIEQEQHLVSELQRIVADRCLEELEKYLLEAESIQFDCDEVRQAHALKARLQEEENAILRLREAIESRDIMNLLAYSSMCERLGLDIPDIEHAQKLHNLLTTQLKVKDALTNAVTARVLDELNSAMLQASECGLDPLTDELLTAKMLKAKIESEVVVLATLQQAVEAKNISGIENGLKQATVLGMDTVKQYSRELVYVAATKHALANEDMRKRELESVVAAKDASLLSEAFVNAEKRGIPDADISPARNLLIELQYPLTATAKLDIAASGNSITEIEEAIEEAKRSGVGETVPEMIQANVRLSQLQKKKYEIMTNSLKNVNDDNSEEVSDLVNECIELGLEAIYPTGITCAKGRLENKDKQAQLEAAEINEIECFPSVATTEASDATEAVLKELQAESSIIEEISVALQSKNLRALATAFEKGEAGGLTGNVMQQARIFLERDALIRQTLQTLRECIDTRVHEASSSPGALLETLNEALETAIRLGLSGDEVDSAIELRNHAKISSIKLAEVDAACNFIQIQSESGNIGITDINALQSTLDSAAAAGLDESALVLATDIKDRLASQVLPPAPNGPPESTLDTDNADVTIEDSRCSGRFSLSCAARSEYAVQNYKRLRSADEYAKGFILNKSDIKKGMLKWQGNLIWGSLLHLETSKGCKLALQIHKCLLGYMGDKSMAFPPTLAQDILRKGLEQSDLHIRDEIFMQIIKQLTANPTHDSVAKGWQMMSMCVLTFPPSNEFECYLINFFLNQLDKKGAVLQYAEYCLRTLKSMLQSGPSGLLLSIDEILAYNERPPVLATIFLVDGSILTEDLPVAPDMTCEQVAIICKQLLGMTDPRHRTFGLFVYDVSDDDVLDGNDAEADKEYADLKCTPGPLQSDSYLGDTVLRKTRQKRGHKIVFKRKIFLPSHRHHGHDKIFNHLVYKQAEAEVLNQGLIIIKDLDLLCKLVAISLIVALGEICPDSAAEVESTTALADYIPPSWQGELSLSEFAIKIIPYFVSLGHAKACDITDEMLRGNAVSALAVTLQQHFVEAVWSYEQFGGHIFNCRVLSEINEQSCLIAALPRNVTVSYTSTGMSIFDSQTSYRCSL